MQQNVFNVMITEFMKEMKYILGIQFAHFSALFVFSNLRQWETPFLDRSAQGLQGTPTTGGHGVIWLDDVMCTGSETSLAQCGRRTYDIGFAGCSHPEDARVICHY